MKTIKYLFTFCLLLLLACQDDDSTFGEIQTPTNLQVTVDVAGDQSGNVGVTPTADGALNIHVIFNEETDPVVVESGGTANFRYTQSGQYDQTITVVAYGTGGASSTKAVTVALDVRLMIDPALLNLIAGGPNESKRWVWDQNNAGHFGVGSPAVDFPDFFSAAPNQLNPCVYDDALVFSHDGQDNYTFQLETEDATFINWAEVKRFFPAAEPQMFEDECRNIDDQIETGTQFVIIENPDGSLKLTVNGSTMSYWSGAMEYEITELTQNKMTVRGLQQPFDPPGDQLAWYHTFIPEGGGSTTDCDSAGTGNSGSGNNDILVWEENFDVDGPPCSENWSYETGTGSNGWGNNEEQYYTDDPSNVRVENGLLVITAIAEPFNGSEYTSARIVSKDKFEFTYGRVEARAKLPTGVGTWPAIWLLGADFETNPWPAAGEIDIMEHVGRLQDRIFSTLHFPGNSGANGVGDDTLIEGVSEEFHIYSVSWDASQIVFSVDGNETFTFANNANLPFNKDFFLILNVAMGGNFGGPIDPNFEQAAM
ncbi:MAG: glycoside hydrolase family 16 protein, partial [Marinirhabdus sp.]